MFVWHSKRLCYSLSKKTWEEKQKKYGYDDIGASELTKLFI